MTGDEVIWQNVAAATYDDERDAVYIVKTTRKPDGRTEDWERTDREEWYILPSNGGKHEALSVAQAHAGAYPGYPVRVIRQVIQ